MPARPFVGQLMAFAGNFAPAGWAFCSGQLVPISQNDVLFALIGTTYGGDGISTFALPDLRGRTPIHAGNGHVVGELAGVETVTLDATQLPSHSHGLAASAASATTRSPGSAILAEAHGTGRGGTQFPVDLYSNSGTATVLSNQQISPALGPATPHNNIQPFLAINWCISLFGIFPTQN